LGEDRRGKRKWKGQFKKSSTKIRSGNRESKSKNGKGAQEGIAENGRPPKRVVKKKKKKGGPFVRACFSAEGDQAEGGGKRKAGMVGEKKTNSLANDPRGGVEGV